MDIIFNNEKGEVEFRESYLFITFSCFKVQLWHYSRELRIITNGNTDCLCLKSDNLFRINLEEEILNDIQELLNINKLEIIKSIYESIVMEFTNFKSLCEPLEKQKLKVEEQYGKILILI